MARRPPVTQVITPSKAKPKAGRKKAVPYKEPVAAKGPGGELGWLTRAQFARTRAAARPGASYEGYLRYVSRYRKTHPTYQPPDILGAEPTLSVPELIAQIGKAYPLPKQVPYPKQLPVAPELSAKA